MVATRTTAAQPDAALAQEPSRAKARGICAQCAHESACSYGPRLAGRAVHHCDEFDGGKPRPAVRAVPHPVEEEEGPGAHLIGLCRNCANVATCTFPKPESGVWSCDEYA